MAKRSRASEETRQLRGEVGVDGLATHEEQDPIEAEQARARELFLRGKAYLGRELFTWLLWRSESGEPLIEHEGQGVTLLLTERVLLKGLSGEIIELSAKGAMAAYSPLVRRALERGLLVDTARLRLSHGERTYLVTLDAEHFDFRSGKLPALTAESADEELEERLYYVEQLSQMVQALLETFLSLRASKRWPGVVEKMRAWMAAGPR